MEKEREEERDGQAGAACGAAACAVLRSLFDAYAHTAAAAGGDVSDDARDAKRGTGAEEIPG